jgi:hypothetical protein
VPGGGDGADVAAYRWRDADDGEVCGDRAHAHRGEHRDAGPVLDELGQVLHVLHFADGAPGESSGGAGDVYLGIERFDYFRHVARRREGSEPPEVLLGLQDRFDTHFLDSPAWRRARTAARPHQQATSPLEQCT